MERITSFRDLKVWQKAMDLVPQVYEVVARLPKSERYALSDQMRRAAVSVPANIAEGHARAYTREFLHHLSIARGSLAEVLTLLLIAERLGYLDQAGLKALEQQVQHTRRLLWALMARLQAKANP